MKKYLLGFIFLLGVLGVSMLVVNAHDNDHDDNEYYDNNGLGRYGCHYYQVNDIEADNEI